MGLCPTGEGLVSVGGAQPETRAPWEQVGLFDGRESMGSERLRGTAWPGPHAFSGQGCGLHRGEGMVGVGRPRATVPVATVASSALAFV